MPYLLILPTIEQQHPWILDDAQEFLFCGARFSLNLFARQQPRPQKRIGKPPPLSIVKNDLLIGHALEILWDLTEGSPVSGLIPMTGSWNTLLASFDKFSTDFTAGRQQHQLEKREDI